MSRFRLLLLASLRGLFLFLLLIILAHPVLRVTLEGSVRRSMQILVDVSQSMDIPDMRTSGADLKRAAIAKNILEPRAGSISPWKPDRRPRSRSSREWRSFTLPWPIRA